MTKDEAIQELETLRHNWCNQQLNVEQDGTSDFMMLEGAISAINVAIDIVKEIN